MGNSITYSYDAKGNPATKTDANGNTITYSYDGLNRLLKKTYPDSTTTSFTYDAKGNMLTAANAAIAYTLTYDASGRVTSVTDANSRTAGYQYNALGNKKKTTYPDGSVVSYNYDNAGLLTAIVNGGGGHTPISTTASADARSSPIRTVSRQAMHMTTRVA